MSQTQKFLRSVKPVALISNFLNFLVFSVGRDEVYVSKTKAVLGFFYLVFCASCKIYLLEFSESSSLKFIFFKSSSYLLLILCITSYLNCLFYSNSIVKVWGDLFSYVDIISEEDFFRRVFRVLTAQVLCAYGVIHFQYGFRWITNLNNFLHSFLTVCTIFHFFAVVIIFANCLFFGRKLISVFNEDLRALREIEKRKDHLSNTPLCRQLEQIGVLRARMKIIKNEDLFPLMDVLQKICENYEKLNEFFGISLMAGWMHCFNTMLISCYFLFKSDILEISLLVVQLLHAFAGQWFLVYACEQFSEEIKTTQILLHMSVRESSSRKLKDAVEHFSLFLLHQKPKFTGCKMIFFNFRLLFSMISSIIAYLVIVLQIEDSS